MVKYSKLIDWVRATFAISKFTQQRTTKSISSNPMSSLTRSKSLLHITAKVGLPCFYRLTYGTHPRRRLDKSELIRSKLLKPVERKTPDPVPSTDAWEIDKQHIVIKNTLGKGHYGVVRLLSFLYSDAFAIETIHRQINCSNNKTKTNEQIAQTHFLFIKQTYKFPKPSKSKKLFHKSII